MKGCEKIMKFDSAQRVIKQQKKVMNLLLGIESAHTVDIEGQNMNVFITTDKIIEGNNLREVTNPIPFKNGKDPTDDGLFSTVIFGETPQERAKTHAYIDLKRKFFHPYIYEILINMQPNIDIIASGQGAWYINEVGELEQIKDPEDARYNENNTGLAWLIENFKKIHFKKTDSSKRENRLTLLDSLTDDEIFISKWVVIPVFYRDVSISASGNQSIPDLNNWYRDIIMNVNSYDNEILSITKYLTLYKIQHTLVTIRKYGQSLIDHKNGAFQKTILGKSVDFGARGVISVPSLNGCERPDDCIVDIIHSGIPLSYCITLGYPFMIKWVTEFFEDTFRNVRTLPVYEKNEKGEYEVTKVDIIDQTDIFTQEFIDKKMETYCKTYGIERFETIKIRCKDGTDKEMIFTGRKYAGNPDESTTTISGRPMTWTDVFYLAAVETLSDKHCYITRYPLLDYFGTFPSKVAVLSTIDTVPVIFNGKVYPHYPKIDLSLPANVVATQFIDTFAMSNLYLDAIGGDYDGDTISAKILFSVEANEEAAKQMKEIKHYVSTQGELVRVIGNESFLTFYNMTRRE